MKRASSSMALKFSLFWCSLTLNLCISFIAKGETPPSGVTCGESLISETRDGVERVASSKICVNVMSRPSGRPQILAVASETCFKPLAASTGARLLKSADSACLAFKKALEAQSRTPIDSKSLIATRAFDLCLRLGGEPSSFRFQWNHQWHVTARCLFTEDYSFLDTESFKKLDASPLSRSLSD